MISTILLTILMTSLISGAIGMAGGLILMGVLTWLLPLTAAMILHGVTQLSSNGFRSLLFLEFIQWKVLPYYFLGASASLTLLYVLSFHGDPKITFTLLGVLPLAGLFISRFVSLDITKAPTAIACGFLVALVQLLAGASGPILDIFYLNTKLNRFEIIATKAITQTVGHAFKILFYGSVILFKSDLVLKLPIWIFPLAVVFAFIGTQLGKTILKGLSELQFQKYSRTIVILIGLFYMYQGWVKF